MLTSEQRSNLKTHDFHSFDGIDYNCTRCDRKPHHAMNVNCIETKIVCNDCGSDDIQRLSKGDESWDVCQDCRSVENCSEVEI